MGHRLRPRDGPDHLHEDGGSFIAAADGIKYMLGPEAVIFLEREAHKRERRVLAPHFHQREMAAYGERMIESADAAIDSLAVGETLRASDLMVQITLRTIVETVFGVTDVRRRERLIRLFAEHMRAIQKRPWFIATLLSGRGPHSQLDGPRDAPLQGQVR